MIDERHKTQGVAIVTARAEYMKPRCLAADIVARADSAGRTYLAGNRPPLVLDTVGLPVEVLVGLLANPPRMQSKRMSHRQRQ
jgi:hypothetical protein